MTDFSDAGLARLLQIDPDTLRRMATALEAREDWEFASACWAALTAHGELTSMPGDELQRLYAAAVANGQSRLACTVRVELSLRISDASREPLARH